MFNTLKILWLKIRRGYHHHMVDYYDRKSIRQKTMGYCGYFYDHKAWGHFHKEIGLNSKIHELKGI